MPRIAVRRNVATIGVLIAALAIAPIAAADDNWWEPANPQTPDSEINVDGEPFTGTNADGEVRGWIDAHTHMFMNEGMGGNAVCGATWSEAGIADALQDCPNHRVSLLENLTNSEGRGPLDPHDTTGWPTFDYWPSYSSLTHQQMYHKWVERAWRGGLRIMVNDMVSNPGLCPILGVVGGSPNRYNCDDMDTVRRQIQTTYDLEAFIDRQFGGEGKGWYRVVTTPQQARDVIEDGKLAVVMGVEVSEPFGCKKTLSLLPGCTKADIDAGLDELKASGVTSMYLCHKFDNALCGVRYDGGTAGLLVNIGQFITTQNFWNPQRCEDGEIPDNTVISGVLPEPLQVTFPGLPVATPIYPEGPHCNPIGLTDLGEYAVRGMIERGMIIEVDHMSAKAAARTLEILEESDHAGVISSHTWTDPVFFPRLFALGGFVTSYGHEAQQYVDEWNENRALLEEFDSGYGFGSDMNGFGGTPAPPADDATISYPFTTLDGSSTAERQVTGERTWDYNTEGVSHYGMLPDWIESVTRLGGPDLAEDLMSGSESYLCMWEKAVGDTCGSASSTPDPDIPDPDSLDPDDLGPGSGEGDDSDPNTGTDPEPVAAPAVPAAPAESLLPDAGSTVSPWWLLVALVALQGGAALVMLRARASD